MTSPARVAANRSNALYSTGPRTATGKLASSRNATRHGLLSRQPLLTDEDPAKYDELRDRLVESLSPDGVVEELLVEELLGVLWRLQRLRRVESALFTIGGTGPLLDALRRSGEADVALGVAWSTHSPSFAVLSRYESAIFGRMRSCLTALQALQAARESDDAHIVVIPRSV